MFLQRSEYPLGLAWHSLVASERLEWRVRPAPRWPSRRCRAEGGRRPPAGPALNSTTGSPRPARLGCSVPTSAGQSTSAGATLTNPNGSALNADQLTVDQSMFSGDGFTATGEVRLRGAHVSDQLDFSAATLTNPDGYALNLQELRVGTLFLRDLTEPPELVDFTHAQVGALVDEPASWPRQAYLNGFVYDALYEDSLVSTSQRLGWLARHQRGYSPQPYEQLAAVYRRAGRDQDARTVAIAEQRVRRRTLGRLSGCGACWWTGWSVMAGRVVAAGVLAGRLGGV